MEEGDQEVCPYDANHLVPLKFLQLHVAKCRRSFLTGSSEHQLLHCPFNPAHIIPAVEFRFHKKFCSTKEAPKGEERPKKATITVGNIIDINV